MIAIPKYKKYPGLWLWVVLFLPNLVVAQDTLLQTSVRLNMPEATLGQALDSLSEQCGCYFTFNSSLIDENKMVEAQIGGSLRNVLHLLISDSTLGFELVKKQVVIYKKEQPSIGIDPDTLQKNPLLTGTVLDAQTGLPLSYANIGIKNTTRGTISNADGFFTVNSEGLQTNDTILISYMGYAGEMVTVDSLLSGAQFIELHPSHISLQEVIVRSRDPLVLLRQALRKIDENYCKKSAGYTTFYREWVQKNRNYTLYVESLLDVYKPAYYFTNEPNDVAQLLKKRVIYDSSRLDTVNFRLQGGVDACLRLDVMRHLPDFMLEEMMPLYDYSFVNVELLNNMPVYVITCKPKESVRDPMLSGRLFIDAATVAVVRAEFGYPSKVAEKLARDLISHKSRGVRARPTQLDYRVDYRRHNNRYYFSYAMGKLQYKVRGRRQWFSNTFNIQFEMVTTKVDTADVQRIGMRERLSPRTIMSDKPSGYSADFWSRESIIQPEEDIRKALQRIENSQVEIWE